MVCSTIGNVSINLARIQNISVLGLGKSAIATVNYLAKHHPHLTIKVFDSKAEASEAAHKQVDQWSNNPKISVSFAKQTITNLQDSQLVIVSPGIPPTTQIIQDLNAKQIPLATDLDLFLLEANARDIPVIAVTGTNGKTTTTSLLAHIYEVEPLGNIGKPFLEYEDVLAAYDPKPESEPVVFVIEVSSFQLYYSQLQGIIDTALYLNFSPDHLDWHADLDEYRQSKEKLFHALHSEGTLIYNYDDSTAKALAALVSTDKPDAQCLSFSLLPNASTDAYTDEGNLYKAEQTITEDMSIAVVDEHSMRETITKDSLQIVGEHNYANALAAWLVVQTYYTQTSLHDQFKSFKAVEHRMEFVAEIDGKKIYNDSKATNPDSSIQALRSFDRSIVIMGGKEKGLNHEEINRVLVERAAHIVTIGETADRIQEELSAYDCSAISKASDLEDALKQALALEDELPVIFSPASSSFDMFTSYEDRGTQFKAVVNSLAI